MPIVDDGGGLSKTVSVEDSFIRGSVLSFPVVEKKLELLYGRLLRLLIQRKGLSSSPLLSYPKVIRVSVRIVDRTLEKIGRRPFRTVSKQKAFNGKQLMEETELSRQESILKSSALPLLTSLLKCGEILELNVTRLNLAVVAFADVNSSSFAADSKANETSSQQSLSTFFNQNHSASTATKSGISSSTQQQKKRKGPLLNDVTVSSKRMKDNKPISRITQPTPKVIKVPSGIDPAVFASLPSDIADEVLKNPTMHKSLFTQKKEKKSIASFFSIKQNK